MNRRATWSLAAAVAMSGLMLATLSPIGIASADEIDDQIDSTGQQLNQTEASAGELSGVLEGASAEVVAARAALQEAQAQLPAAQAALATAEAESARAAAADAKAAEDLRVAEAEVARTKAEIEAVKAQIEALKVAVGSFARDVYTGGGQMSEMQVLLDSTSPAELTTRYESIQTVSRDKNRAMDELVSTKAQLDDLLVQLQELEEQARQARVAAAEALDAAQAAEARAEAAKSRVDQLVSQRTTALATTEAERTAIQQRYAEVAAAQAALSAQLTDLQAEKQRRVAAAEAAAAAAAEARAAAQRDASNAAAQQAASAAEAAASAAQASADELGSVSSGGAVNSSGYFWPIPGAGTGGQVGPRVHPVYGYASCHTGVDISAGSGTPIRATHSGTVVSASYDSVYGNRTVIDHGDGTSSMYAHQSSFAASAGQRVSAGDVIGFVGSTGYSTGAHLHFEIHVGGTPYNPMGWFGGSSGAIRC